MNKAFFLQLVFNGSLLLTLALIYDLVAVRWRLGQGSLRQVPVGVVIGIMGVIVMLASWKMQPGIVFDTRSILLGISGLFFGTVPTVVAMVITAAFRASMGGPAVGMGIAVIVASGRSVSPGGQYAGLFWPISPGANFICSDAHPPGHAGLHTLSARGDQVACACQHRPAGLADLSGGDRHFGQVAGRSPEAGTGRTRNCGRARNGTKTWPKSRRSGSSAPIKTVPPHT